MRRSRGSCNHLPFLGAGILTITGTSDCYIRAEATILCCDARANGRDCINLCIGAESSQPVQSGRLNHGSLAVRRKAL